MDLYYTRCSPSAPPSGSKEPGGRWIDPAGEAKRIRENPGNQWFKRGAINSKGYNDAQASLSRAVKRLEARGLVVSHQDSDSRWAGIRLTDDGRTLASELDASERRGPK